MKLNLRSTFDTVIGNPSQVQQVLMNLATNAAHAMRERGGVLAFGLSDVTLTGSEKMPEADMKPGSYVTLRVRDTGTGMTEDVQKRAFEPFFTTKGTGEGTGMGLAVVYGIVKSHGGAISVKSKPGKGSMFTIFLPYADVKAGEDQEVTEDILRGNEKILFVDDEAALVEMASQMLSRLGYDVTTAGSANEALTMFLTDPHRFDLVITDQTMPDLTGIDLAQRMLEVRNGLPILLITGYSETVSAEKAKSAGISEFIMKPLAKREVAETIRRTMDRRIKD
jgi:CheY-like chemotaxis protein